MSIILLSIFSAVTYAWFTDKKTFSTSDLEIGTIEISANSGSDTQTLELTLSRNSGALSKKIMPGDKISCSVNVQNIGTEPCYYLACFVSDNNILATSFNMDYFYQSSTSSTLVSTMSTKYLGTLSPNETQTINVSLGISQNLSTGQNTTSVVKCYIYAIQVANLTESEAWDKIQLMKSNDNPESPKITLYNEDGTVQDGSNSITSNIKIAYTDSTKSQFYIDASSISTNLENSSGEDLYFYSTTKYSDTAFTNKYSFPTSNQTTALMSAELTSKTDTSQTSYLAELSKAQNYDLTFDLNNKIIYDTPSISLNLYPVFLTPNYGDSNESKNTYTKDTTPYLILSKDKTSTTMAEFNKHTNIKAVVIPNTIETITEGTFVNCLSLKYVTFPTSNLKTLGYQSFCRTAIEELILPDCIESLNNGGSSTAGAFYGSSVKIVYLGEGIKNLSYYSFYKCLNLKTIYFPSGLESIEKAAFYGCSSLETVNLPSGLESIGRSAFYGCSSLKTIDFPSSLKSINIMAFADCGLSGEIGIPYQCEILSTTNGGFIGSLGIIGFYLKDADGNRITETTFTGQSGEITYFTNGDGCLYKKLEGNNVRLELFPSGYTKEEFNIGANVTQFRRFELENSYVKRFIVDENNEYFENDSYGVIYVKKATSYDGWEFKKDMLLSCPTGADFTSYTMKEGISGIYLFSTSNLEHLTIPTSTTMTTIPGCCFQNAKKLKTINSSVDGVFDLSMLNITGIGYKSFERCYELKEIILPASCTEIGNGAFMYSGITKLTTYATTKLTLSTVYGYVKTGNLLNYTGTYFENETEKYQGLQNIYVINSDLITEYQNDSEWSVYLNKADGEDYKLNISVIA